MARPKKNKIPVTEVTPPVVIVGKDELVILESDNDEQKRLKGVFSNFRTQNPELWNRDKQIYLQQIEKAN
jgi:hypothetical protein